MSGSFLTADLSVFLNTDEFAETATRSNATTFPVIFDYEYVEQLGTASRMPMITAKESVNLVVGESLTIRSIGFTVGVIEPDGTGLVQAQLIRT